MAQKVKVYSVQPRFKVGTYGSSNWSLIDGIFKLGMEVPPYGDPFRDVYLAQAWYGEPMIAGVFSTWIEKTQTMNWKIVGGKKNANYYANLLHTCDDNRGWDYHEGISALSWLSSDKGVMEELGRQGLLKPSLIKELQEHLRGTSYTPVDLRKIQSLINKATLGKVTSLQAIDPTRMLKIGLPGITWRLYPERGHAISIPNENLIQMESMPSIQERFYGFGHCAMSRMLDAKQLMLGYLTYYRQEIGDLPPELVVIINNLPETKVQDSLRKYKEDRKNAGHDIYSKIWWLGTDDPGAPVDVKTISLTTPNKAFSYQTMTEWWAKTLAVNTGEDVGEYWLLQRGESKTVQTIQAKKSEGKGVGHYMRAKERRYNLKIMPFGVLFTYDNPNDDADLTREEILALKVGNLAGMAEIGVDRQDPAYSMDQIRELAIAWEIIPPEMSGEDMPLVLGAMLKSVADEDLWVVTKDFQEYRKKPLLKSDKEKSQAQFLYNILHEEYHKNGIQHKSVEELEPVL